MGFPGAVDLWPVFLVVGVICAMARWWEER
jgi:hypothetical protein